MQYFVQQLINGLTLGSIYGLIAIGYTMVYGIIGMINFAHGDIFMVGAFTALIVFLILGALFYSVPVVIALLVMMIVAMLLDQPVQLDDREGGLPAAARFVPAGAADHRDRHVDRAVEFRPGDARAAQQADPADGVQGLRHQRHQRVAEADHHRRRHRAAAGAVLVPGQQDLARVERNEPASRTARWRHCSASTSTAPSRSPSSWAPPLPPSPARCS